MSPLPEVVSAHDVQDAVNELSTVAGALDAVASLALMNDARANSTCSMLLAEELYCLMRLASAQLKAANQKLETLVLTTR